ncbi:ImmA/IrrE family metallo-endopeptidase [Faecalispora jeddahensis]|uniref:ImmA/IrrE family metallo-endopeptidase n=1 Tax=Faecalispora jeddahensis TaxID=1414721 RepID=UPI001896B3FC|nr:ImmA/IrrE family metallo-endopeptidase [Faecalispora jeddahensis]MDU6347782.1 ImmA/IrrE family metallo-endopeptidase [Clostridium sp.]
MVELNTLYEDMQAQQVALYTYDVGVETSVTIELNNRYAIFLDPFRVDSIPEMKRILAHELGHCATGCTHKVSSPLDLIEKHEYKANRWAIERYIPFEEVQAAIKHGFTERWQLAEYFNMPEAFIKKALEYYFSACQRKMA